LNIKLNKSKILVTGGAGFIGSNLCEELLMQGHKIYCLDNFITGKKENISQFLKNENFRLIEGDIRNKETCLNATTGMDYVFHQAALGSVPRSIENPEATHDVNINGFMNILIACRDQKVKRFIYASSSSVYGDNTESPKTEENTGNPLSPYAVTKQVNELYAKVFSELYPMEIIGLRYFNVFGKHQDPDGPYAAAIPRFLKLLLSGTPPSIYGDGNQSRDFTYIDNVVNANVLAAATNNTKAIGQVYNVACGEKTSVNDLCKILISILSKYKPEVQKIKPVHTAERKGDIRDSLASIKKAKDLLGYSPVCDTKTGLEASIEWYVKHLA
jgi:UDP-N-acetylglucosamine/UDP-N-acetylgalactosamine 4-epimerase